jgi:hypothetical protein
MEFPWFESKKRIWLVKARAAYAKKHRRTRAGMSLSTIELRNVG